MEPKELSTVLADASQSGMYAPAFEHDACGMGFIAHLKGVPSHQIIEQGLEILENLTHRGARGSEVTTGDGAGMMVQMPHAFLQKVATQEGVTLPAPGHYGVGMVFLAHDTAVRRKCQQQFAQIVTQEGQQLLGWRRVPTKHNGLGKTALAAEPQMYHCFIGQNQQSQQQQKQDPLAFERKLYVIRKRAEHEIKGGLPAGQPFYFASLSSRTLVYKGMLLAEQLRHYFPDLADPDMVTAVALVHSRFSTNTFPSWERAHPYRYVIHNGEINTVRGNVNWMRAREALLASPAFGDDLQKILPIIDMEGSDTAMFDNTLEFLVLAGYSLPHAVMMMIPEPWQKHTLMDENKRAFYEFHSALMEPWDGPAAIGFTDGTVVGAVLDRNGLRPSRYTVTKDDLLIMASETGVLDIPPENVAYKGRLQPGRMLLADTSQGRIIGDEELKAQIAGERPYRQWLDKNMVKLADLPAPPAYQQTAASPPAAEHVELIQLQQAFGYTFEELRLLIAPMAQDGKEALGSMGDDTPLAVLSQNSQPLYNYFKQLFAQVTNPPIDAIREELVTSTETLLGSEGNLLDVGPESCRFIKLPHPILLDAELNKLRHVQRDGFKVAELSLLYNPLTMGIGLEAALDGLFAQADEAIANGCNILVLSDRGVSRRETAVPALLATAGLHHHLIRQGTRTRAAIVVESGEPREVHHFAVLLGYGADAINPYLAYQTIGDLIDKKLVTDVSHPEAIQKYVKAVVNGVVKILSKMGISTVQSYRGAQIFEALGLHSTVIDKYFIGTPSRVQGIRIEQIAEEVRDRHAAAFPKRPSNGHALPPGGRYQYREGGEPHLFNPETIHKLQHAVRNNDYEAYKAYARTVNDYARKYATLRGLLRLKYAFQPLPLDEVEPVESIIRRFKTGAMSYGSISKEAHETLAIAMNRLGGKSNTGEGGEDPSRYIPDLSGDSRNSAIKQVASGRFGVTSEYLVQAREIQIKMAQGAKPGEGGQLPGRKVYPWIAKVRHSTPGVGLISPPPHHDIYSIEDLAQLIYDLKNANPQARINVKLVSEIGVGTVAAGVAKGYADVILISGHDGGTGASPQTSIKHAGLPWELGLAEAHQTLLLNGLRSRVRLETDGQLKTGRDVVIAALLGAEEFGFATAPLVAMGCIMMRVCHKNTCPVGVATQNPELRKHFMGKPEHVEAFMRFIAQEMREIMASLGVRTVDELVGRTDLLETRHANQHWKARGLDLSPILYQPPMDAGGARFGQVQQVQGIDETLDVSLLLDLCRPAVDYGRSVRYTLPIRNIHRTVGTRLGSEITRRHGANGLPDDTIHLHFQGSAGQSFGAFIPKGMTLELEGDANDYLGKGLSGGRIVVYPPAGSTFAPEENIIIGNVAFYGGTSGEAFISGVAGERFAVRNSGVTAVVEGVGDHGCEYMTGGRVVVLGQTGRNFAAGMSGGVAYVLDADGTFASKVNRGMVDLEPLTDGMEIADVYGLIEKHYQHTRSPLAARVLRSWPQMVGKFVKVMPRDYKRMLEAFDRLAAEGYTGDELALAAFQLAQAEVDAVKVKHH